MTSVRPSSWIAPVAVCLALLIAWEVAGRSAPGSGVPVPSAVLGSIVSDPGFYAGEAAVTLFEAVAGLGVAVVVAVAVAGAFARWVPVRQAFFPLVVLSQTIPLVAIAPLLAAVIGDGMLSRVLVTAWLCWFPVVVGATHGMLNVDPRHLALFDTYEAPPSDIFWKLRVPSCASSLLAGVRAGAGFALIGAIVVEYSGATHGLGAFLMGQAIHPTDATRVFGVILVSAVGGLVLTESAHALTRRLLRPYLPVRG